MIAATKPKKPKTASQHPKVSVMVNNAISTLKERGGSSIQAIKKYIASHYKVNSDKLSPFIKRYLRNSVASGILIQTKGTGASGSFKLAQETSSKSKFAVSKAKKPSKSVAATKLTKSKIPKKISPREKHGVIKSKNPKKSKAIKSEVPKSKENAKTKKIGGIMRIDGTKAPSSSYVR